MKKILILLSIILGFLNQIVAQNSRNGYKLPTQGNFRIFVVFAEVADDTLNFNVPGWNKGQMPDNPDSYIDAIVNSNYQSYISRCFYEASFGQLNVIGDYHPNLLQFTMSEITSKYQSYTVVFDSLQTICNGGQILTSHGLFFPNDFDNWTLAPYYSDIGLIKPNIPDGKIDCIMIFWRENSKVGITRSGGEINLIGERQIPIGNKTGVSKLSYIYYDDRQTIAHEFAHGLVGDNTFHSGGANSNLDRIYMQNYSGYSILAGWNRYHNGCNGWDRYWLGWKHPQKQYYISARNIVGQEVTSDLVYGQTLSDGDSAVYVIKNFATSGDAVRIKLPYVRSENTAAKEQWLWIENHQLLPGTIEYDEGKHGQNSPMHKIPRGIYMNIQVGNENFSDYNSSGPNNISPLNSFGNYDFTYSGDMAFMSNQTVNPFTGVSFGSYHSMDMDEDDKILCKLEEKSGLLFNFNGVQMNNNNWASPVPSEYYMGSVFDAFYQGDKIALTTNPTPVPRLTYNSDAEYANSTPKSFDNRKIYLNGICVRVLEQMTNGDIKISVRWNDSKIQNNVRWCGDIVLNETIDVQPSTTVLLDQGLTPVRPVNPITFNGEKIFASPTSFTCNSGSEIKVQETGSVVLKNNSSITALSSSTITIYSGANITIESGSTLQLKAGANLNIVGSGKIVVKSGAYLCIESGAYINLQDYNSLIVLEEGAEYGGNPSIFTSPSCESDITITGDGSIADFNQDIYIQNETISSDRYITGRNIYIGYDVTTTKPYGNVLINGNCIVICKAAHDVIITKGFDCVTGSIFEIQK